MTVLRRLCCAALRRRLARDERGTSVVELALIAPILAVLTMGIIDLSAAFGRRLELTEAANGTMQRVAAMNFDLAENADGSPDFSALKANAAAAAGVSENQVTVTRWLECDGVEQDEDQFNDGCPVEDRPECEVSDPPDDCSQVTARYVEVRVEDSFAPMFSSILARGPDGTIPLSAEAAVRIQ